MAKDDNKALVPEKEVADNSADTVTGESVEDSVSAVEDSTPKFTKKQLIESNWYSHRRDILTALLSDDEMYSHAAVDKLIKKFLKERVK